MPKKGLLERLNEGVVIGDGGFTWQLEKRGYVKAGAYTPEVVVEKPDAVLNLHQEFVDAGSDVMQAFTFYASEDRLSFRGNKAHETYTSAAINRAACQLAKKAADSGNCLLAAGLSQIPMYSQGATKEEVHQELQKQLDIFLEFKVDFLICEFFKYVEEMEWAIEVAKRTGLPVVATMCIGPHGDQSGVPTAECGLRMARAGADVIGVNCLFDPSTTLKSIRLMRDATNAAGLEVHFAAQPLAFHVPEEPKGGYWALPDYPLAMEPRLCTRFDFNKYAREAYELGVRYIGGCCGTEAYHIRAVVEELEVERGNKPKPHALRKHEPWGGGLRHASTAYVNSKASRDYWEGRHPATGRPFSPSLSTPHIE